MFTPRLHALTRELAGARLLTSVPGGPPSYLLCASPPPTHSPCCRVSQPKHKQLERWQPLYTCNIIVPVMKSAPAPEGERRRFFWQGDQPDLPLYNSTTPSGLNHRSDEASAARRRRLANCAKKKKKKERESSTASALVWRASPAVAVGFFGSILFFFS